jgi:cellulose biosynthesis protein BcsQ
MAVVISMANNKGGVGKTTASTCLADALGRRGRRICFLDMDSQCNATSLLLQKGDTVQLSLANILDPRYEIRSTSGFFYPSNCKNVVLVPNIYETAFLIPDISIAADKQPDVMYRLSDFVHNIITAHYDYIIIDLPPDVGLFTMAALYTSEFVIVPIKASSANSIQGLDRMVELISDIREKPVYGGGNPKIKFMRLLINCADRRTQVAKSIMQFLRDNYTNKVFDTEIPESTCFHQAELNGKTVLQDNASSVGAKAYRELAEEIDRMVYPDKHKEQ